MNIGQKIKQARLTKGLTQEELGNIVGVQKSAIAKYENGKIVNIKRSTMRKIASALNIRPSELIFEDSSPEETAELHVKILSDLELMDAVKKYYDLDAHKQKIIRDLINSLNEG